MSIRVVGVPSLSGVSSRSEVSKGRPWRCGPNGDGVVAASVIRYGRAPSTKARSKTCSS